MESPPAAQAPGSLTAALTKRQLSCAPVFVSPFLRVLPSHPCKTRKVPLSLILPQATPTPYPTRLPPPPAGQPQQEQPWAALPGPCSRPAPPGPGGRPCGSFPLPLVLRVLGTSGWLRSSRRALCPAPPPLPRLYHGGLLSRHPDPRPGFRSGLVLLQSLLLRRKLNSLNTHHLPLPGSPHPCPRGQGPKPLSSPLPAPPSMCRPVPPQCSSSLPFLGSCLCKCPAILWASLPHLPHRWRWGLLSPWST